MRKMRRERGMMEMERERERGRWRSLWRRTWVQPCNIFRARASASCPFLSPPPLSSTFYLFLPYHYRYTLFFFSFSKLHFTWIYKTIIIPRPSHTHTRTHAQNEQYISIYKYIQLACTTQALGYLSFQARTISTNLYISLIYKSLNM